MGNTSSDSGDRILRISVNEIVHLTEVRDSDKPALVEHLKDKFIYDSTLENSVPLFEC